MKKSHVVILAAALSYMSTLAFLPLAALFFYIYRFFGGIDSVLKSVEPYLIKYLAPDIASQVLAQVSNSLLNNNIETIGATGLVVFFLSSFYLLSAVENVVNIVWKIKKKRKIYQRWISYFSILIIAPFLVAILFSATTISSYLPIFDNELALFVGIGLFISFLYKYLPNVKVRWLAAIIAALVSSGLLLALKHGYAYYLTNTLSYSVIYGSLAILPIMQLWIYLTWLIVLMGVIFSEVIHGWLESEFGSK